MLMLSAGECIAHIISIIITKELPQKQRLMKVEKIIRKMIESISSHAKSAAVYLRYTLFASFEVARYAKPIWKGNMRPMRLRQKIAVMGLQSESSRKVCEKVQEIRQGSSDLEKTSKAKTTLHAIQSLGKMEIFCGSCIQQQLSKLSVTSNQLHFSYNLIFQNDALCTQILMTIKPTIRSITFGCQQRF